MHPIRHSQTNPRRYTRVRTGCQTCRLRRVKCDEQRPVCLNCSRLRRECAYETDVVNVPAPTSNLVSLPPFTGLDHILGQGALSPAALLNSDFDFGEWGDLLEYRDGLVSPSMPPSLVELSTPAVHHGALQDGPAMFPYFTSHVNPPFITPFDSANWVTARKYIAGLATRNVFIAAAIRCVEALYQCSAQAGEISGAMQSYFTARSTYLTMLNSDDQGLEAVLIVTFLLCSFEMVAQQETIPHTLKQKDTLVSKLGAWTKLHPWPPVARRIAVWLRWFHTKAMHLGGRGILSPQLLALLPVDRHPVPSLSFLDYQPYDTGLEQSECMISTLFHFYDELQDISVEASALNRHHRSRGTVADETGVLQISVNISNHLSTLWQARPRLLWDTVGDALNNTGLSDWSSDLLMVLCKTCYFAETVYLDRAHSKDHSTSPDAQSAMQQIRQLIEDFSVRTAAQQLDAAFLWPLFLYAVESRTRADVDWALSKLRSIHNPLWQSDTVTTFVRDLTGEQLSRGERVDSRFFCLDRYGGAPPYI